MSEGKLCYLSSGHIGVEYGLQPRRTLPRTRVCQTPSRCSTRHPAATTI